MRSSSSDDGRLLAFLAIAGLATAGAVSGSRGIVRSRRRAHGLIEMVEIPGIEPFLMARTETTQAQWMAVMGGENPSSHQGDPELPVENVNWDEANDFADRLSDLEGLTGSQRYRLPTEAEWEYAARGGETFEYAGSDDPDEVAWTRQNSGGQTHPVGRLKANGYGLFDMSGNVWEWTSTKEGSIRVGRGGGWGDDPWYARVAARRRFEPGDRRGDLGFRLARSIA